MLRTRSCSPLNGVLHCFNLQIDPIENNCWFFFFDFHVNQPGSLVHTYTSYITQIHLYTYCIDPHMHQWFIDSLFLWHPTLPLFDKLLELLCKASLYQYMMAPHHQIRYVGIGLHTLAERLLLSLLLHWSNVVRITGVLSFLGLLLFLSCWLAILFVFVIIIVIALSFIHLYFYVNKCLIQQPFGLFLLICLSCISKSCFSGMQLVQSHLVHV